MSYYGKSFGPIRCALNYGRELVESFCRQSTPYRAVLDLGAGPGDDLMAARRVYPQAELNAVEINPRSISLLEQKDVCVFSLDLERDKLPFQEGSIDLIIANQVLEHLKDLYWVFHQVSRVLPVGGRMIIGVPNLASLHNRILLALGLQPTSIKTNSAHVRGFTRGDLLGFLEEVFPGGYVLRSLRGANFYPLPPFLARPFAKAFPSLAWGMFLLIEKRREYQREFLDAPIRQQLETKFYLGDHENSTDTRFSI